MEDRLEQLQEDSPTRDGKQTACLGACAEDNLNRTAGGRGQLKCDDTRAGIRFRLSAKRTSLFQSAGERQFSQLLAAKVCASAVVMLDTLCSEAMWSVLATHSIRQFPLHFPSRAAPCAITFQLDSTTRRTKPARINVHANGLQHLLIIWAELVASEGISTLKKYSGVRDNERCYNEGCYNKRMLQRTVFINKIRMLHEHRCYNKRMLQRTLFINKIRMLQRTQMLQQTNATTKFLSIKSGCYNEHRRYDKRMLQPTVFINKNRMLQRTQMLQQTNATTNSFYQ